MKRLALAVTALLAPLLALADVATWNVDPAHTQAVFVVRHLAISNVRGQFGKVDGKLVLDEGDLTKSRVEVTIDANSIDTRNEKRDAHLKSPDFFDAANHPNLTFKSTRIEKAGGGYKVTGDLTIRGNTKPATLDVDEFTEPIKDMQGSLRRAMHATGKIDRKQYGLLWNAVVEAGPVVSDEVKMEITAEFVKEPGSPAAQAKAEDKSVKEQKPGQQADAAKPKKK